MWKLLVLCEKMSKWAICSKKQAIRSFTHFWWATWAIFSHRSFLVSDLIHSLTLLIKKEGMSESLFFFTYKNVQKTYQKIKNMILVNLLIRSIIMSNLTESLTVALLTWAPWEIRSQSLICSEQSERITHNCSFDLSNLSKWAMSKWGMSVYERMNKFPTL